MRFCAALLRPQIDELRIGGRGSRGHSHHRERALRVGQRAALDGVGGPGLARQPVLQHEAGDAMVVRAHAEEFHIDPSRVGVMGFSAGGEVAALAASRWESPDARPAFQALIYPALPKDMRFSKEETPPAFLACGENDRQNISQGLPELYLAMKKAGASAELHVFSGVGHGFGVRDTNKGEIAGWLARFREWMETRGYLKSPQ
jgi:acetyl esterase/lipase